MPVRSTRLRAGQKESGGKACLLSGPFRERREAYLRNLKTVDEIVAEGCARARKVAGETMEEVRAAMKLP